MLKHDELRARMLKNPAVRKEYERLEKEGFALLDLLLVARHEAGLTQAEIAKRMGTQPPASAPHWKKSARDECS